MLNLANSKILVVGDVMLDKYWHGTTTRISPEAPVPIVNMRNEEIRLGGAGNVALNISMLGIESFILAIVGNDIHADNIVYLLNYNNIKSSLIRYSDFQTITKLRILSGSHQYLRVDFEDKFESFDNKILLDHYTNLSKSQDLIILSDYLKGTLLDIDKFIQIAKLNNIPIFVDPKGSDFNKYNGVTLITPNLTEFITIVGECKTEKEIEKKAKYLIESLNLTALLLTRGEGGMTLFEKSKRPFHLSAISKNVFDVTGAGDTVIATMASCYASGMSLQESAYVANVAASIVVSKVGTTPVTINELNIELSKLQFNNLENKVY